MDAKTETSEIVETVKKGFSMKDQITSYLQAVSVGLTMLIVGFMWNLKGDLATIQTKLEGQQKESAVLSDRLILIEAKIIEVDKRLNLVEHITNAENEPVQSTKKAK